MTFLELRQKQPSRPGRIVYLQGIGMIHSCEITNFRGFKNIRFEKLGKVNLITGRNNVGKTALLEALFVLSGGHNPNLLVTINTLRGQGKLSLDFNETEEHPWDSVFHNFDPGLRVELSARIGDDDLHQSFSNVSQLSELSGLARSVQQAFQRASTGDQTSAKILKMEIRRDKVRVKPAAKKSPDSKKYFLIFDSEGTRTEPPLPRAPMRSLFHLSSLRNSNQDEATRFSRLQVRGKERLVCESLQILEPRLRSVSVIFEGGEASIQGDIGLDARRLVPLSIMGEGMSRLATVVTLIAASEGGVLFLDDIDSGIHYSAMDTMWKALAHALNVFNVQLFASTHRSDCIVSAHNAFRDDSAGDQRLLVHRLERTNSSVNAYTYDSEALDGAIEGGLEVR